MLHEPVIIGVLSGGIALAGLLLVFSGFLIDKAASYSTKRGDVHKWLAKATLIPVLAAIAVSWLSLMALNGNSWAIHHLFTSLKVTLVLTALFAIIGTWASSS